MKISRRHIVGFGSAYFAAAAVKPDLFAASPGPSDPLLSMSRRNFVPYLQTTFLIHGTSLEPTWLTLTSIDDMSVQSLSDFSGTPPPRFAPGGPRTDAFALNFYAVGEPLQQDTYEMEHASLGHIQLLIVPLLITFLGRFPDPILFRGAGRGRPLEQPLKSVFLHAAESQPAEQT